MRFSWNINLGNVLAFIGFVFTLLRLHRENRAALKETIKKNTLMEMQLQEMYGWFCLNVINKRNNRNKDNGPEHQISE